MSRAAPLLLLAACLDPGVPLYNKADTVPPALLDEQVVPRIFFPDAGRAKVQPGQFIILPFTEPLDQSSLRPGIVIRKYPELEELPLLIQAPPAGVLPYTVRVASAEATFASGLYAMQLRTLLIDVAGNPLEEEITGFFDVP